MFGGTSSVEQLHKHLLCKIVSAWIYLIQLSPKSVPPFSLGFQDFLSGVTLYINFSKPQRHLAISLLYWLYYPMSQPVHAPRQPRTYALLSAFNNRDGKLVVWLPLFKFSQCGTIVLAIRSVMPTQSQTTTDSARHARISYPNNPARAVQGSNNCQPGKSVRGSNKIWGTNIYSTMGEETNNKAAHIIERLLPVRGLEPLPDCSDRHLKTARLPIPPHGPSRYRDLVYPLSRACKATGHIANSIQ